MQKRSQFVRFLIIDVRKYPFSTACVLLIWYLSFFTPPKTDMAEVPFIDKWVHIAMYGLTCGMIWLEYFYRHKKIDKCQTAVFAFALPIVMSGIIELLQEYCTGGRRSGDWLDLLANAIGVALAALAGYALARHQGRM